MQGTILIIDSVSTNRIMLKVLLSSAWYHVAQHDRIDGALAIVRRVRPDLILCAMSLADGDAIALHAALQADPGAAAIPVVAVTDRNDRSARLRALAAGVADVLGHPVGDALLRARIRILLRWRAETEDMRGADAPGDLLGLAEPAAGFVAAEPPARVVLIARQAATGAVWRSRMAAQAPHVFETCRPDQMPSLMSGPPPDAIVVEWDGADGAPGSGLMADLRARGATRSAAVIAIAAEAFPERAAEALDRGADDVMTQGFCAEELGLRLAALLRRKARADRMRGALRDGLRAAMLDPLTGLYNRRYALPHLCRVVREAAGSGSHFAVMLADLDHFKQINDRFGHAAGDIVLTEAAHRMRAVLRQQDMIARVGGEEFLIVLPDTAPTEAALAADRLRCRLKGAPFRVAGVDAPVSVTISIGVVVVPAAGLADEPADQCAAALLGQADRALYDAKGAGRNQVSLTGSAA